MSEPAIPAPETRSVRLAPRFGVTPLPLTPSVGQHASGFNASLTRPPACEAVSLPLPMCEVAAKLRPDRLKVMCVKLTFPAGFEFIPPREKAAKPPRPSAVLPDETAAIEAAEGAILDEVEVRPKRTRLKPPPGTLSLQDRLFYVLQPPLEDWLAGQELVMPFEPFPYQYEGIAWLFSRDAALLADEMGLGKTMQTITGMRLLLRSGQARRVLLICPKPLIPNWQREFALWAPELPVTTIEGPTEKRKLLWDMPGVGIYLVNYEAATRDLDRGESGEEPTARGPQGPAFDLLVLDEAQRIKNRDSRTARVARDIDCGRAWALTGTPIENRPDELVSLFEFLQVVPPRAAPDLAQLRSLSEANILRRTKDLVMTDMPPRIDQDELLELTPGQQAAYHHAEKEGVVQLNEMGDTATVQHVFELVLRLKQISNYDPATGTSCKVDRLCADMEEIAASGGKAILFSQWTKTIDWIDTRVREAVPQSNPLIYHGGVPTKQREPILQRFKEDPRANLLLMSYGTGAVGLNLQFAGYVYLYDRWWNPAVEDQAINRAHRIGQKSQVLVKKFICRDTVEERIDRVLAEKRALFQSILGDAEQDAAALSMNAQEIFGLFDMKAPAKTGGTREIGPKAA